MTATTRARRPLVGRSAELSRLVELVGRAVGGSGGCAVVTGEPGSGKTRLVEALVDAARDEPLRVCVGRAFDREVARILGVALDALELRLDQLLDPSGTARFVLEANAVAATSFLLVDRLVEIVEGLCADGPVLLVLEDLHWSDATSLAWLRAVVDRAAALPLAVVVTTRPLPTGSWVRQRLNDLDASTLRLGPLTSAEVDLLAVAVMGGPPDPELRTALDAAAGNPLLVLGLLEGGGTPGSPGVAGLALRLAELRPTALRAVQAAAVLAPAGVAVDVLATVLGQPPLATLADLEDAAAAGLLVPDGHCFAFRHEIYRETVRTTISHPARALLHLEAARALVRAGAPMQDIAEHYAQGARPGDREALRWLHEAATAVVAASPATALRLSDAALRIAGAAPADDIILLRVRALAGVGRAAEADLLGRSLLRDGLACQTEATLRRELAFTALIRGQPATCVVEMQRSTALAVTEADRSRANSELAFARFMTLDHLGARAAAEDAVDGATRCGDVVGQVAGEAVLCFLDLFANRVPAALRRAELITQRAELPQAADAHAFQPWFIACLVALETDRLETLRTTAHRGREIALSRGTGWAVPGYDAVNAFAALRAGALDDAAATAEAALGYLDGVDGFGVAVWCHAFLAQVRLHQDDLDAAEVHLAAAERWLACDRAQLGFEQVLLGRALAHERRGAPDAALAALRFGWDTLHAIGVLSPLPALGVPLARLAADAGEGRLVAEVAEHFTAAARTCATPSVSAIHHLIVGWRDGDPERALAAADLADDTPRTGLAATAWGDAADLLRRCGRRAESQRAAAEAARRWGEMGAFGDADALALRIPATRRPRRRPRFGVDSLTATERRVVALVADGLANSEIAGRLGVSRRTVESHVSSTYRKLDVSSRVGLARTALAHGLG